MRLQIKVKEFSIVHAGKGKTRLELTAGRDDVFGMMDEMSPKDLADYMMHRMRDCFEQKRENTGERYHKMTKEDRLW